MLGTINSIPKSYVYVTSPLGRKSNPTIYSINEDFPADCDPKSAILGKLMNLFSPASRSLSINVITFLRFVTRVLCSLAIIFLLFYCFFLSPCFLCMPFLAPLYLKFYWYFLFLSFSLSFPPSSLLPL